MDFHGFLEFSRVVPFFVHHLLLKNHAALAMVSAHLLCGQSLADMTPPRLLVAFGDGLSANSARLWVTSLVSSFIRWDMLNPDMHSFPYIGPLPRRWANSTFCVYTGPALSVAAFGPQYASDIP